MSDEADPEEVAKLEAIAKQAAHKRRVAEGKLSTIHRRLAKKDRKFRLVIWQILSSAVFGREITGKVLPVLEKKLEGFPPDDELEASVFDVPAMNVISDASRGAANEDTMEALLLLGIAHRLSTVAMRMAAKANVLEGLKKTARWD